MTLQRTASARSAPGRRRRWRRHDRRAQASREVGVRHRPGPHRRTGRPRCGRTEEPGIAPASPPHRSPASSRPNTTSSPSDTDGGDPQPSGTTSTRSPTATASAGTHRPPGGRQQDRQPPAPTSGARACRAAGSTGRGAAVECEAASRPASEAPEQLLGGRARRPAGDPRRDAGRSSCRPSIRPRCR